MTVAIPALVGAAASYGATTYLATTAIAGTLGATIISGLAGAAVSSVAGTLLAPRPQAPDLSAFLSQPGANRTQQFRQPTAPHEVLFGTAKKSGPVIFLHSAEDDENRADGYFYVQHVLAAHHVKRIGDIYLGDELATDAKFTGYVQIGKNLGTSTQVEDADFLSDLGALFTDHWLRGRANIASRLKIKSEPFPNGAPNIAAVVQGNDEIYDPR